MHTVINKLMLTLGLCIGLAGVAQAGLIGNAIDVQYIWPSAGSVNSDLGTITVTSVPQTVTFQPYFNVTISDTQIVVNGSNYGNTYSGSFNGQYLIDQSVATFPAYSVDPSSVLTGGSPIITIAGNTLEIDFHGLSFQSGEQLVLDVAPTAVPEPAPIGLIGISLAALALFRRHRTT